MNIVTAAFTGSNILELDITVPRMAVSIIEKFAEITQASNICGAGGYPRGLYFQQGLAVSPKMNDIDIFADISVEDFEQVQDNLQRCFGNPIRLHIGRFEQEENFRGLIEFAIPEHLQKQCAGVESVQLNFGRNHPWASPIDFITKANVGMNQTAITSTGQAIATKQFLHDMNNQTMTMNPNRVWTLADWNRTTKSLKRMAKERPEFSGWQLISVPQPPHKPSGTIWKHLHP